MRSRVSSSDSLVFSQKLVQDCAGGFFLVWVCLFVCFVGWRGFHLFIDLLLITPERIQDGRGLQHHPPSQLAGILRACAVRHGHCILGSYELKAVSSGSPASHGQGNGTR